MTLAFLMDYVVLIVVGICICVGFVIKNLVPSKEINRFIPLIMAVLGVVLNMWIGDWSFTPSILLGGLISGLASTGAYELFRNFIENFWKKE